MIEFLIALPLWMLAAPVPAEPPEEITVYGSPPGTLRHELYRTEERVFEIFNSMNSDDEYDVHCEYRLAPASHLRIRVCEANFVGELSSQAAFAAFMKRPVPAVEATMLRKRQHLLEEMRALARERPELMEALIALANANDALKGRGRAIAGVNDIKPAGGSGETAEQ